MKTAARNVVARCVGVTPNSMRWLGGDSRAAVAAALLVAFCGLGCGPARSGSIETPLPSELTSVLSSGAALIYQESTEEPMSYHLWILRDPDGTWLEYPEALKPLDAHDLPASVLTGLLATRAPRLDVGTPLENRSRYVHWTRGDTEIQVREIVTDRGWFASVEQFRK